MLLEGLALALAAADPVDLQVREGEEWLPTQLTVLPVRPVVCVMHPPVPVQLCLGFTPVGTAILRTGDLLGCVCGPLVLKRASFKKFLVK